MSTLYAPGAYHLQINHTNHDTSLLQVHLVYLTYRPRSCWEMGRDKCYRIGSENPSPTVHLPKASATASVPVALFLVSTNQFFLLFIPWSSSSRVPSQFPKYQPMQQSSDLRFWPCRLLPWLPPQERPGLIRRRRSRYCALCWSGAARELSKVDPIRRRERSSTGISSMDLRTVPLEKGASLTCSIVCLRRSFLTMMPLKVEYFLFT
jgi:hypothetical protein